MFDFITNIDFAILKFAESIHTPLMDKIMSVITFMGDGGYVWIFIGVILLFIPKYRKTGITVLIGLIFFHLICNTGLKNIIARPRPFTLMPELLNSIPPINMPHSFSMPSGHTMSSVVSAYIIATNVPELKIPSWILATGIAISRIYLLVHYPTDVIVGAILGVLLGMAMNCAKAKVFKEQTA